MKFIKTFAIALAALTIGACGNESSEKTAEKAEKAENTKKEATVSPEKINRGYLVDLGDTCPEFSTVLDNGTAVESSSFEGKVVMLQFTASWCSVCRKEMPFIEDEIWAKYKDREDFVLIGVDRDEPLEKVQQFAKQMKITYPLALDPGADIFAKFAHRKAGVTRNVILNKKGEIVYLSRLFERAEFDEMKEVIAAELAK